MKVVWAVLAIVAIVLAGLVGNAEAETYYVSPIGSESNDGLSAGAPRQLIKAVLLELEDSDSLIVLDGVYDRTNQQDANLAWWRINADSVTVLAEGGAAPVIDFVGQKRVAGQMFLNQSEAIEGCAIEGLTFSNWENAANFMRISAGNGFRFVDCEFLSINPTGASSYVIAFDEVTDGVIKDCRFLDSAHDGGYRVFLRGDPQDDVIERHTVEGCVFNSEADLADTLGAAPGILALDVDSLVVKDCVGFNAGQNHERLNKGGSEFVHLRHVTRAAISDLSFKRYRFREKL